MLLLRRSMVCLSLAGLLLAGCNSGKPAGAKPTVPVTVTVTYKGAPVEGATVTFVNEGDPTPAQGRTDAQGVAKMKTYVEGDGAVVGKHRVSIMKTEVNTKPNADQDSPDYVPPDANTQATVVKDLIPKKYATPASGLTADVTEGGTKDFKFELTD